jgi:(+)-trans-carveol dehydrogenase
MIAAGNGGSVVLMSSVAGLKGIPFTGAYVASKHAIQGLMKVLALELAEHRIRVNTVNPGGVETPMTEDTRLLALFENSDADSVLFGRSYAPVLPLPSGGLLSASHVSAAIAWLVSDEAQFITGTALPIDAGAVLR